MTFFEKTKRFLEPLTESPKYLILSGLKFMLWAAYSLSAVFLLKNSLHAIERGDFTAFTQNVWYFIGFVVFYFILNFL
jgi:predicted ATPase